jgi:hypothetical protein
MKIEGGCLCGKVRYSADTEPAFVGVCHCKNCQKQAGTAFSVVMGIPAPALSIEGELKTYEDRGDSGQVVLRRFCPNCGSPIAGDAAALPGVTIIKTGTLDDTSWLQPTMEVYCDSKQPWVSLAGDQHHFPKMPPR